MKSLLIVCFFMLILSCSNNKIELKKLDGFDEKKYLGKWYEIARIENRFEKHLINVTAEYTLNEDGSIKVTNKGFDDIKKKEKTAVAKAKIIDKGVLKVYFFPFIGGDYNVIYVDEDYKYALVGGGSKEYLWVLSRENVLDEEIYNNLLDIAEERGYDISLLERF